MYGTLRNLSTSDDTAANCLNKIWCGAKIRLRYKSATSLNLNRVCSSFFGSMHPYDFCNLLKGWVSGNGFEDRWLITVVDDIVSDIIESDETKRDMPKPNLSFNTTFQAMYEYFHVMEETQTYNFDLEAYELLGSMSKDLKELKRKRNEKIHSHGITNTVPENNFSKLEDNVRKVSLALHILSSSVTSFFEDHEINVPNIIPLNIVQKALKFVKTSADALKHMDTAGTSNGYVDQTLSFQMTPGAFVTSRIYNDTFGDLKHFNRMTEAEFVTKAEQLENQGYGLVKQLVLPVSRKQVACFYKSPLTPALKNLLMDHNFIPTEYAAQMGAPFKIRQSKLISLQLVIERMKRENPYDKNQETEEEQARPLKKKPKVTSEELVQESDSSDSDSTYEGVNFY